MSDYTDKQRFYVIHQLAKGVVPSEIAKTTGIKIATVYSWKKEYEEANKTPTLSEIVEDLVKRVVTLEEQLSIAKGYRETIRVWDVDTKLDNLEKDYKQFKKAVVDAYGT